MRSLIVAAKEWWMPIAAAVSVVGIIVLFVLLIPALGKISAQAKAGNQAKARQCLTLPAATKVYLDARTRSILNDHDVSVFLGSRPRGCGRVMPNR
jgi:hypothetical protein